MTSRVATSADVAFLRDLHHQAYRAVVELQFGCWNERAQDQWFDRGLLTLSYRIIEHGGCAVGAIAAVDADDHIEIAELQVLPAWQRRGVGTATLREQLERARRRGVPVRLRVLKQSVARQLYERLGFQATGELEHHITMSWSRADHGR